MSYLCLAVWYLALPVRERRAWGPLPPPPCEDILNDLLRLAKIAEEEEEKARR